MRTARIILTGIMLFLGVLLCVDFCGVEGVMLDEKTGMPQRQDYRSPRDVLRKEKKADIPRYAPGEIIVKFRSEAELTQEVRSLEDQGRRNLAAQLNPDITPVLQRLSHQQEGLVLTGISIKDVREMPQEIRSLVTDRTTMGPVFKDLHRRMRDQGKTEGQLNRERFNDISRKRRLPVRQPQNFNLSNVYIFKNIDVQDKTVETLARELSQDPNIEYAQPNYLNELYMVPNDPYYHSSGSWGQGYDDLWGLKADKLNCEPAWDITQGEGVVVAVIDTGVNYNHEDITENIYRNDNGDIIGYDFSDDDSDPIDCHGHGTHCAGTIAAIGNNGIGVIGLAPKTKIMPVKIFPNSYDYVCAQGIRWAADNGADVLSNSWGAGSRLPSNLLIEEAIDFAYSLGCVVIFAAGNSNDDVMYYLPANYSKTIAVAATDSNDSKAYFSNYGNLIDVAAPGVDILSLRAEGTDMYGGGSHIVDERYYRSDGTSMACPHVSGLAALVLSCHPEFTNEEVRHVIRISADDIGTSGWDEESGHGRINVFEAMQLQDVLTAYISNIVPMQKAQGAFPIEGSAFGPNFDHWVLEYAQSDNPAEWKVLTTSTLPIDNGLLYELDTSVLELTHYIIRLQVFGSTGDKSEFRALVAVFPPYELNSPQHGTILTNETILIKGELFESHFNPVLGYELMYGMGIDYQQWSTEGIDYGSADPEQKILASWDCSVIPQNAGFITLKLVLHTEKRDFQKQVLLYKVEEPVGDTETPWKDNLNNNDPIQENLSGGKAVGYKFTPLKDGQITGLGGRFPGAKMLSLWDSTTKARLDSLTVSSTGSWNYATLNSPIAVKAGHRYIVSLYSDEPGWSRIRLAENRRLPQAYGSIKIESACRGNDNDKDKDVYPYHSTTSHYMYGQVDIEFVAAGTKPNHPPRILKGPDPNPECIEEDETARVSVCAKDEDEDPLSYSWITTGGSITGTGCVVTYHPPDVNVQTTYTVMVAVSDGRGGVFIGQPAYIVVTPVNHPPVNHPPEIISGPTAVPNPTYANVETSITVQAVDPDEDPLMYAWQVPVGAGTISGSGNTLVYIPTEVDEPTVFSFYVDITDGQESVRGSTNITVTPVDEPVGDTETPWKDNLNDNDFIQENLSGGKAVGYRFTPLKDGQITKLGGRFQGTKMLSLWNCTTRARLASATVSSTGSWNYATLNSPIAVKAGHRYIVSLYSDEPGWSRIRIGAKTRCLPQTYGNIKIESACMKVGDMYPYYLTTGHYMYGQVDIEFVAE